jgi:hypothetical protein
MTRVGTACYIEKVSLLGAELYIVSWELSMTHIFVNN